jgi:hypothetical protein
VLLAGQIKLFIKRMETFRVVTLDFERPHLVNVFVSLAGVTKLPAINPLAVFV